jgi:hypothetical protein
MGGTLRTHRLLWLCLALSLALTGGAWAQEQGPAPSEPDPPPAASAEGGAAAGADLAKQLSNPVSSLISVPFQTNWDFGVGPEDGERFILNFQPVMPFSLGEDWNLIARVITPLVAQPVLAPGGESTFGLGDIVPTFFLSPKEGGITWGVGPVFSLPATSIPTLGSGRWSLGPSAVVLKQVGPWTMGGLVNHVWSVGGDEARADVNSTFMQPFLAYGTSSGYTFSVNSEMLANWEAADGQEWTIPVNFVVSKMTMLGRRPIQVQAGVRYFLEKPTGGPSWGIRLGLVLVFPLAP